jgi:hypothetical protein
LSIAEGRVGGKKKEFFASCDLRKPAGMNAD